MSQSMTEIVFILDRSGSMGGTVSDTIGGYNALLEKQRVEEGKANVTTVLFDSQYELLYNATDITKVKSITAKEYFVRGNTALLDAVGKTINTISGRLDKLDQAMIEETKVLFVIITDGFENASKEYNHEAVKKLIDDKKAKGWEFIYLGADFTDMRDARRMGIQGDRSASYSKTNHREVYNTIAEDISYLRRNKTMPDNWKEKMSGYSQEHSTTEPMVELAHSRGRLIVDTGSPISFGLLNEVEINGQVHRLSQNDLINDIRKHMGRDIMGLIGMDILSQHDMTIRFDQQTRAFDLSLPDFNAEHTAEGKQAPEAKPIKVDFLMGIPILEAELSGVTYTFFLDTGAEISYINDALAIGRTYCGTKKDFYPMLGTFETDTFEISAEISGLPFSCNMGILPDPLKNLMPQGIVGILGTDFLKQFKITLGFKSNLFFIEA